MKEGIELSFRSAARVLRHVPVCEFRKTAATQRTTSPPSLRIGAIRARCQRYSPAVLRMRYSSSVVLDVSSACAQVRESLSAVVRVDGDKRAFVVECLSLGQASDLEPPIVHPLQASARVARPDDLRQRVGQRSVRIRVVWLCLNLFFMD